MKIWTPFPVRRVVAVLVAAVSCLSPLQPKDANKPREAAHASAEPNPAPPDEEPPTEDVLAEATKGDIRAQVELAYRYRDGKGVKRDYAEALRWAHRAADLGDAGAQDLAPIYLTHPARGR